MASINVAYGHKIIGFIAATTLAAAYSVPALANVQTWNFNSASQSFSSSNNGNTLNLTSSDGIHLTVTGLSDTNDSSGADEIETAQLIWAQSAALGIVNRDEDTTFSDHSIESESSDSEGEFDMLLLEFDTVVNLNGIHLSWATGGNNSNTTDLSILAYAGPGSSSLLGETWGGVLDTNGGAYDSVGNYSNVGLSYYAVNPTNVSSTKWLVGMYNPVFGAGGDAGDDGMMLASITTSTPGPDEPRGEVPVTGTLLLVMSGLLCLRARGPSTGAAK